MLQETLTVDFQTGGAYYYYYYYYHHYYYYYYYYSCYYWLLVAVVGVVVVVGNEGSWAPNSLPKLKGSNPTLPYQSGKHQSVLIKKTPTHQSVAGYSST